MSSACSICIEDFTKQPHKKQAKCPYCDIAVCTKCTQTYLLGTHEDPHCMGCRRGWSREVLDAILLTTWINGEYKKHRENVLYDREKSRLPAAQIIIERKNQAKELKPQQEALIDVIANAERDLNLLRSEYYNLERRIQQLMRGNDPNEGTEKKEEKERRLFIMPCPANECRGFLSQAYKCGVCNIYACPECREVKGEDRDTPHTCDKNVKANVERLKKECRPCPECGSSIFKIEGCDQMYCTACNTPFSWTTGKKVVSGNIHNPHYFEYLRKANGGVMPRAPGDIPCLANLPSAWSYDRDILRRFGLSNHADALILYTALNVITHISQVEVPNVTNNAQDLDNTNINVRYLTKEIDLDRWKQLLQQREKKRTKRDELRMRYEAFVGACIDIYGTIMRIGAEQFQFINSITDPNQMPYNTVTRNQLNLLNSPTGKQAQIVVINAILEGCKQLETLRSIFNEGLMDISKRYKCQVLQLSPTYRREYKKYESGRAPRKVKKSDGNTVNSSDTESDDEDTILKNIVVNTRKTQKEEDK